MLGIKVTIVRFTDESQPGWVECAFIDASGVWRIESKAGHSRFEVFRDQVLEFTHGAG